MTAVTLNELYPQPTFDEGRELVLYDIATEPLLRKYAGLTNKDQAYEQAATDLIPLVRNGTIWFPFQRYFRGNPDTLFANLKTNDLAIQQGAYRLHSYYPQYGSYLPPRFRDQPITVAGNRATYETVDVISDHFIENVRLKAKRYDQIRSILECWTIDSCLKEILKTALHKSRISPQTLRDSIYETVPETKIFNPTWAKALLKLVMGPDLAGKKWLDISAGWGDRLITAMALDMDYTGFDPNIELRPGHSAMIQRFGNPKRHQVIYEPFEKATIPDGPYDVILSSPPYFTIEEYAPGQAGQSIVSYPDQDQWMVLFLFASLEKAWKNLKDGGYLILHLGDAKTIVTSEAANIFIENYLPGASWEGVIGLQGEAGYPRPVWVWRKAARNSPRVIWEPETGKPAGPNQRGPLISQQRTLYRAYPKLQAELIQYFAATYAPYYAIRRSSAEAVKDHVAAQLPHIPRAAVDLLLQDNLLISSLLEVLQAKDTIAFLTNLVSKYPNMSKPEIILKGGEVAPYYSTRKTNSDNLRQHVAARLPTVGMDVIQNILGNDLLLSSLLEVLGVEGTITWSVAMIKLALRI